MKYYIPDKVYDVLKWVCITLIPLIAWAYGYFGGIWAWPMQEQIIQTITGIGAFCGVVLGIDQVQAWAKSGRDE